MVNSNIPLVRSNSINDINTSIIAIKKELKANGETDINVNVDVNYPENAYPVDAVTDGDMHAVTSNAVFDYVNATNKIKSIFTVSSNVTVSANNYASKVVDISAFGFTSPPIVIIVPLGLSSYGAYQIDQVTTTDVTVLFYNHHAGVEITPSFQLVLIQV